MAKYNWRTHEWKTGDRFVFRSYKGDPNNGRTGAIAEIYVGTATVRFDDELVAGCATTTGWFAVSKLIPLRKKSQPEQWTMDEIKEAWNYCLYVNVSSEPLKSNLLYVAANRVKK